MKIFATLIILFLFFVVYYLILRSVAISVKQQRKFRQQVLSDLEILKNNMIK